MSGPVTIRYKRKRSLSPTKSASLQASSSSSSSSSGLTGASTSSLISYPQITSASQNFGSAADYTRWCQGSLQSPARATTHPPQSLQNDRYVYTSSHPSLYLVAILNYLSELFFDYLQFIKPGRKNSKDIGICVAIGFSPANRRIYLSCNNGEKLPCSGLDLIADFFNDFLNDYFDHVILPNQRLDIKSETPQIIKNIRSCKNILYSRNGVQTDRRIELALRILSFTLGHQTNNAAFSRKITTTRESPSRIIAAPHSRIIIAPTQKSAFYLHTEAHHLVNGDRYFTCDQQQSVGLISEIDSSYKDGQYETILANFLNKGFSKKSKTLRSGFGWCEVINCAKATVGQFKSIGSKDCHAELNVCSRAFQDGQVLYLGVSKTFCFDCNQNIQNVIDDCIKRKKPASAQPHLLFCDDYTSANSFPGHGTMKKNWLVNTGVGVSHHIPPDQSSIDKNLSGEAQRPLSPRHAPSSPDDTHRNPKKTKSA